MLDGVADCVIDMLGVPVEDALWLALCVAVALRVIDCDAEADCDAVPEKDMVNAELRVPDTDGVVVLLGVSVADCDGLCVSLCVPDGVCVRVPVSV